MINRESIKERAKGVFMNNYWLCVAIFAILAAVSGSASGFSSSGSSLVSSFRNLSDSSSFGEWASAFSGIIMVSGLFFTLIAIAAAIFVSGPFSVSSARAALNVYDGKKPNFKDIIFCFRDGRYWKCVGTMALQTLFVVLAIFAVMIPVIIISAIVIGAAAVGAEYSDHSLMISLAIPFACLGTAAGVIPATILGLGFSRVPYLLAEDDPASGMELLKKSWRIMKGHKAELFVFGLSFIGWILLTIVTLGVVGLFYTNPYMNISYAGWHREFMGEMAAAGEVY